MITAVPCTGADFCEEISGAADTSFRRFYEGDPPSRRVHSTPNFELLADLSPLTTGHLLLLPKRHYLSFAQVLGEHQREAVALIERVRLLYREVFGEPLFLEHGSSTGQVSHACITHAHLHLLPVSGPAADRIMLADGLRYHDLDSITELARPPWPDSAYFLRSHEGHCRVYLPTTQRRQYLRSVAGSILSIDDPEWDYAVVMRKDALRSTMRRVRDWPARLAMEEPRAR
ncbi:HIT family protein [Amycolatopsis magusensis]|uniref:Diadenosine tetraphosphate (Ap4A) HIT family hydrolase n=1 Tax=Amycolatopsis magusensis TaxID=882444 RepID=A0ABS4PI98_9PSEU|nr:HIT domain-containing protein [Amycolatopsis magusensis]MBP2179115.1 diadenosine tetraphosphate (Ap4A) HIT family hydrolase [Amycolatopsis magusensis]